MGWARDDGQRYQIREREGDGVGRRKQMGNRKQEMKKWQMSHMGGVENEGED